MKVLKRKELKISVIGICPHCGSKLELEKQDRLMKALQISNARIGELIEKNYYLKKQLEKQGEHEKGLLQKLDNKLNNTLENETPESLKKFLNEQKLDDNEPKFHEGEWLCENEPNNYARFIQILEIVNVQGKERYRISRDIHNDEDIVEFDFVKKYYHKFDIKDAKDGDVLADGNLPFIFKKIDTNKYSYAYCGISVDDGFKIESDGESGEWTWMQDIKPATKEQRDLLFKKMHEVGYEWNAEKKELKKIEQKKIPIEGEFPYDNPSDTLEGEIENIFGKLNIEGIFSATKEGFREVITHFVNYIKQQDDEEIVEPNTAWSEEDNLQLQAAIDICKSSGHTITSDWLKSLRPQNNITDEELAQAKKDAYNNALDKIEYHSGEPTFDDGWSAAIDYIQKKSIRPQKQWKPSDEQMQALSNAGNSFRPFEKSHKVLWSLYNDLKKLMEE